MQPLNQPATPRIAIIGAGMAGISCAQTLQHHGAAITLFEKSRGIGGRLATRRSGAGECFDHGAQYMTTQTPEFTAFIEMLQQEGAAARWQPRVNDEATGHRHPWLVGTPGMNALLKPLAKSMDVRTDTTITDLRRDGDRWQLLMTDGEMPEPFDVVISTAPAAQTRALLAVEPLLQLQLDTVTMAPCWALMITFRLPLSVDYDVRRFDHGTVAWLARQASRPARKQNNHTWVLHASPGWSIDHLELKPDEVASLLLKDLARAINHALPEVTFAQAHRWRYAMTTQPLGRPFVVNADHTLFAGGDWCLGARVECAYQSGVTMAEAIAKRFSHDRPAGFS